MTAPRKARMQYIHPIDSEAWWYGDRRGIDVVIRGPNQNTLSCRIGRKALKDWIARTEPKKPADKEQG